MTKGKMQDSQDKDTSMDEVQAESKRKSKKFRMKYKQSPREYQKVRMNYKQSSREYKK
jgi:hypothetical protein